MPSSSENRSISGKLAAPPEQKRQHKSAKTKLEVVRVPAWSELPWLLHGFSTRTGGKTSVYRPDQIADQRAGELNLGFTASDTRETVLENRRLFISAVAGEAKSLPALVTLKQIHSSIIQVVSKADAGEEARHEADGMMTNERGILLGIQTADCIPVLIADRKQRAVAAFHAGWRGTLKRIVEHGVGRMRLEFGSRPEDLIAAIGPGIAQCCYAVGEEVRSEFESQFAYASELFREVFDSDPIKKKYPKATFNGASEITKDDKVAEYELDIVTKDKKNLYVTFDKDGKFIYEEEVEESKDKKDDAKDRKDK